jgi:hypothetical protein
MNWYQSFIDILNQVGIITRLVFLDRLLYILWVALGPICHWFSWIVTWRLGIDLGILGFQW